VIIPQAVPPIIPAMGNYLVAMFKDTPLLYAITVQEMLTRATNFSSRIFSTVEAYTLVGLIFLMLSLLAAGLIHRVERWLVVREI
jgi:polar amino acid transport system permease protein